MKKNILLVLVVLLGISAVRSEIVAIFELARHGARTPLLDIKNNSNWIKSWGLEELTDVGMRMHYHLGKSMKEKYTTIFDSKFTAANMDAISTNFNRTIVSGLSHFTGIFDQFQGQNLPFDNKDPRIQPPKLTINPDLPFNTALPNAFTPIPITSKLYQRILMPIRDDCPYGNKAAAASKAELSSSLLENINVKNLMNQTAQIYGVPYLEWINEKTKGVRTVDLDTLYYMADYAISDYHHNPEAQISKVEKNQNVYSKLLSANSVATFSRFYSNPSYVKSIVSEVILDIFNKMKSIVDGKYSPIKYYYYSGHDDMLTAILLNYNLLSTDCILQHLNSTQGLLPGCQQTPQYAANIVWELHKNLGKDNKTVEWSVIMAYNGDNKDFCYLLNFQDKYACPWNKYKERIEESTNSRYKEWCANGEDDQTFEQEVKLWKTLTWILLVLILGLVVVCLLASLKLKKQLELSRSRDSNIQLDEHHNESIGQRDPRV